MPTVGTASTSTPSKVCETRRAEQLQPFDVGDERVGADRRARRGRSSVTVGSAPSGWAARNSPKACQRAATNAPSYSSAPARDRASDRLRSRPEPARAGRARARHACRGIDVEPGEIDRRAARRRATARARPRACRSAAAGSTGRRGRSRPWRRARSRPRRPNARAPTRSRDRRPRARPPRARRGRASA